MCDETYTCVCTSKCNVEICKTKCNGGVAFTFANEYFCEKTKKDIDKPAVFQYNTHVSHVNDS